MNRNNETLITSAADLEAAFKPCPQVYVDAEALLRKAARVHTWVNWLLEVESPKRNTGTGGWYEPSLYLCVQRNGETVSRHRVPTAVAEPHKATRRFGDYNSHNGKVRVESQWYPRRKDGTFNEEKILEALLSAARREYNEYEQRVRSLNGDALAEQVRERCGLQKNDYMVRGSVYTNFGRSHQQRTAAPGHVYVSFEKQMTEEQAVALVSAMRELGLVK